MSNLVLEYVRPTLPWDPLPGESRRFRVLMAIFLLLALAIWIVVPRVELPKLDRAKAEAVPERLAKVVMQRKEVPPPPPPQPKVEKKVEEVKPAETTVKKEEAAPRPVDDAAPKPVVTDLQRSAAKARASQAIQEAGFDDLAELRNLDVATVSAPRGVAGAGGSGGLITGTEEAGTTRNLITSRAGTGSGTGSGVGAYGGTMSSGYGGGKAGGKGTGDLLSAASAAGGGSKLQTVKSDISAAAAASAASRVGKDGKARRSNEEIRKTFDRYFSRVFLLYQRALRDDPTMQGTVTMQLGVAPDGSVSAASITSSQLNNDELEAKIITLVKGFNFGPAEVEPWSGPITMNFMPQ